MKKILIAVVGPTAIGKTARSIDIARHFGTEIISCDSRQFYKEMTIGTAVPSKEELAAVRHHFIQHKSIFEPWTVGDFERSSITLLKELFKEQDIVVVVGGSGLYLKALTVGLDFFPDVAPEIREKLIEEYQNKGLSYLQEKLKAADPAYFEVVDQQNPQRLMRALEVYEQSGKPYSSFLNQTGHEREFSTVYLGLEAERELIYERIELRVERMIETGLLEEATELLPHKDLAPLQTVGYQELFKYLEGEWNLETAISEIKKNTRRYAKRQLTWFRRNKEVNWLKYDSVNEELIQLLEIRINELNNG